MPGRRGPDRRGEPRIASVRLAGDESAVLYDLAEAARVPQSELLRWLIARHAVVTGLRSPEAVRVVRGSWSRPPVAARLRVVPGAEV